MSTETVPPADTWAIVELLGHVRIAGRLTEEERFGGKLGRLDMPTGDTFVTRYFGHASVYSITIVSEEAARAVSVRAPAPVSPWELPKQLPAPAADDPARDPRRRAFDYIDRDDDEPL